MDTLSAKSPLFTNKALVSMTIPVMLDALLQILAGTVDSVMVSSAGEVAVSAVALVDAINIMFLAIIGSLAAGGSVITTQYVGSRNYEKSRVSANQLFYVASGAALIITVLLLGLYVPILRLFYGKLEADVFENALKELKELIEAHADGIHENILFFNAWNEWSEGSYLEPDTVRQYAFLEAVKRVLNK